MKNVKRFTGRILILAVILLQSSIILRGETVSNNLWSIIHDPSTHQSEIQKKSVSVLKGVTPRFKANGKIMGTENYDKVSYSERNITDEIGEAKQFTIKYESQDTNLPDVEQSFYLYNDKDFILTDLTLSGKNGGEASTNYLAPIFTKENNVFLPQDNNNRFLTVPFDNDGFIEYGSYPLSCTSPGASDQATGRVARDSISFEVTAIFNGIIQQGMVIGSVDHDTWKSAIRITGSPLSQGAVTSLESFSGVTHAVTRDTNGNYLQPHGTVSGPSVRSARMILYYSDDWRDGLETFGEVCAQISGKAKYDGPTPYGWNSWGGMATNVNYSGVISVSDFIKNNLQGKGGFGDGVVYVGLDSFWDNMNWDELKAFADHCYENGQVPGIYWTPWCDWLFSGSRAVEGNNGYFYEQGYLKVNGATKNVAGALCMDPTAPATISRLNFFIDKFKSCGFKYLKLDFLTNGIVEGDSYWDKNITTGVQAYNYGMKKLRERCGDDMFIVESIAPLFPAQYANARRISCDAWGEMYHIAYMMNSYSFGWWLNRVYNFNDPDHLVMGNRSDAENMSRMTTGAITGYFMLGDNLSTAGSFIGTGLSQQKSVKYSTNEAVNDVVKLGGGFRPAYGHKLTKYNDVYGGHRYVIDLFYKETDDCYLIAYFNYSQGNKDNDTIDLELLGINPSDIDVSKSFECWTGGSVEISGNKLTFKNVNDQARLWRLYKK
ncbi:MAG: hypothetical protein J1F38_01415 [Muribaculaceae bacterium]|nr:hypothetical protein [Muribaculaceae bacterium]